MMPLHNETTATVFNAYEYERGLGQANPIWEPVPDYIYPLNTKEIIFYSLFVIACILLSLGIMIGFIYWAVIDLSQYIIVWVVLFLVSFAVCIFFLYTGGKDRRRQEKDLIEETNRKQQDMMMMKHN